MRSGDFLMYFSYFYSEIKLEEYAREQVFILLLKGYHMVSSKDLMGLDRI